MLCRFDLARRGGVQLVHHRVGGVLLVGVVTSDLACMAD